MTEQAPTTPISRRWHEFLTAVGAFSLLTVFIISLWLQPLTLLIVALLLLWHDRYDVGAFLVVATLGSLAEVVFVASGVWTYARPTWLGIPLWFPVAFGTAALIGQRFVRALIATWDQFRLSRHRRRR